MSPRESRLTPLFGPSHKSFVCQHCIRGYIFHWHGAIYPSTDIQAAHDDFESLRFREQVKLDTQGIGLRPKHQVDPVSGYTTSFVGRCGTAFPTFDKFEVIGSGESGQVDVGHTYYYGCVKQNLRMLCIIRNVEPCIDIKIGMPLSSDDTRKLSWSLTGLSFAPARSPECSIRN
jgi:hypothetical protein